MDSNYFSRAASWSRLNDRLVVHDSNSPRMITMEPWHELIFMAADGEHTIGDFIEQIGSEYEGGTPPGLREQVYGLIGILIGEGILRVHDSPKPLPPYHSEEYFAQPPEVRKAQLEADGLLKR